MRTLSHLFDKKKMLLNAKSHFFSTTPRGNIFKFNPSSAVSFKVKRKKKRKSPGRSFRLVPLAFTRTKFARNVERFTQALLNTLVSSLRVRPPGWLTPLCFNKCCKTEKKVSVNRVIQYPCGCHVAFASLTELKVLLPPPGAEQLTVLLPPPGGCTIRSSS